MTSLCRLFPSAVLVTAMALAAGCDPERGVHLNIRFGGDERKSVFRNPGSPTTRPSDVDTLTLEAYNPGTGQSKSVQMPNNFTVSDQTQAGGLAVTPGDGWRVLLTGTDRDGHLYGMGRTASFTIPEEGTVDATLVFGIADDFAATAKVTGGLGPFGSANALPDGSALLIGPGGAFLHDPTTGRLCGDECLSNRPPPRQLHVAVSLSGGNVFIAGGVSPTGTLLQDAYLFNAGSKSFSVVPATGFPGRAGTAAAALQNGQVLMAGGRGAQPGDASRVLVVDPATGSATPAANLAGPAVLATATALDNGDVLVAGGFDPAGAPLNAAVVYLGDGSTKAVPPMLTARGAHSATRLQDGYVLIYGGGGVSGSPARFTAIADPEAYVPQAERFIGVSTTATLEPRAGHTGILLDSGALLLIGGNPDAAGPPDPGRLVPAVRFTPAGEVGGNYTGNFDTTGQIVARTGACSVALPDLSVLVAGGAWPALGADPLAPAAAADWVEGVDLFVPCQVKDHTCPR